MSSARAGTRAPFGVIVGQGLEGDGTGVPVLEPARKVGVGGGGGLPIEDGEGLFPAASEAQQEDKGDDYPYTAKNNASALKNIFYHWLKTPVTIVWDCSRRPGPGAGAGYR